MGVMDTVVNDLLIQCLPGDLQANASNHENVNGLGCISIMKSSPGGPSIVRILHPAGP